MPPIARALVIASAVWVLALFLAPAALDSSSPAISHLGALVYAAGGVVCHQRPERSFMRGGRQLPVCARCTGLYVSALAGGILALIWPVGALASARARWLLAIAALPTAATWAGEVAGLMHPSNAVRAVAAAPLGAAAAWLVVATLAVRSGAARRSSHAV